VTVRDLLLRLPTAYDDLRRATALADIAAGDIADGEVVLVRGVVRRIHVFPRRLLDVVVEDGGATLRARWFRPPAGMSKRFVKGAEVALAGPLRTAADGTRELTHPTNLTAALASLAESRGAASAGLGLRPRYAPTRGVGARVREGLVAAALACVETADGAASLETLPAATCARLGLPTLREALRAIHEPPASLTAQVLAALRAGRTGAHTRLALEELVAVQTAFLRRRARAGAGGGPTPVDLADAARVTARVGDALGFALTAGQSRALEEIARDLGSARPMQRLLVGDVGSGKTAVAFGAAALVADAGGQTLLMAPTEVLAAQHARALGPRAARLGFRLALLTAGTPARARAAIAADVAAGRIALVVGTHAVLDASLAFADLRLVVVDEQHRFGVEQRARARRRQTDEKGSVPVPHLLALSATPIPRTLALALHGDLDASVLDERPAGRRAPATLVCAGADARQAAYARLADTLAAGQQAFVVCPVRERARRAGAVTAISHAGALSRRLAPARVGLLHGELSSVEKDDVLRAFADGALDVLVATTVVELGIDVPNATLMIVEQAERFGLAQLHQLRGRVGRGAAPGLCLLCPSDEAAAEGAARLATLAATDDGFAVAEADLAARGFGDLFGTRQAGAAGAGGGDLRETFALVELARREAEALVAADPTLARPEHAALARAADALEARRSLYDESAG